MNYSPPPIPVADRMWPRVAAGEPFACWPFTGTHNGRGYGKLGSGGRRGPQVYAHRVAYEDAWGPIPAGLHICHDCDNPRCVNPLHLFAGTRSDNMQDMLRKGRGFRGQPAGENHAQAKLSDTQVALIRTSPLKGVDLARLYGVTPTHICKLRRHGRRPSK